MLYAGTVGAFPASGVADPGTWSPGEVHVYAIAVQVHDDVAAQGASATTTVTWEARR